jgi:DNA (cytosine-5)-methyltransferase 1
MHRDSGASAYEFFAGGGLARLGLEPDFRCIFANDIDQAKARAYAAAFGGAELRVDDVWRLSGADLPGQADLAWASFPCQDLSLAGARGGLKAARSGAFWGFHKLMGELEAARRAPGVIALENVCGLISSHGGADFTALIEALAGLGYVVGALELDAALFTPQSRPRLIVVAAHAEAAAGFTSTEPSAPFHSAALRAAAARLPAKLQQSWVWWRLETPPLRNIGLVDILEDDGAVSWDEESRTQRLLAMMHTRHQAKVDALQRDGARAVGTVFKRVRVEDGVRVQRAEPRFDGLAGCLRTPAGGSSRQTLIVIEGERIRTRLISPREAARLMGAPDDYPLPARANAALALFGDAVCVPAVRWLSQNLLAPMAARSRRAEKLAS